MIQFWLQSFSESVIFFNLFSFSLVERKKDAAFANDVKSCWSSAFNNSDSCAVLKSVIVFDRERHCLFKFLTSSNFCLHFNSLLPKADFCLFFSNCCLYLWLESLQWSRRLFFDFEFFYI